MEGICLHFYEVAFFKSGLFRSEWGEVATDFVDGETGGESNTLFHLLLGIDLSTLKKRVKEIKGNITHFRVDFLVTELADFSDIGTSDNLSNDLFEDG